jgi:putative aldouronate transport system permease protein
MSWKANTAAIATLKLKKENNFIFALVKYKHLYMLLTLPILYFVIFKYIPIIGNIVAIRSYIPGKSMFGEKWVGLKYFEMFIKDPTFWGIFWNTITLGITTLVTCFPIPIIFALLLNEIRNVRYKKFVQTVSYLPHFISVLVIVGMMSEFLSPTSGLVNTVIKNMGCEPIHFMIRPEWFRPIYISTEVWQGMGWSAIIYIAALSNIDIQLYEAAEIDGASRIRKILSITIPGISSTIVITFIITIGQIMNVGFEKVLLLMNGGNQTAADVISTYVYRMGIVNNNYSFSAAVGLFEAVAGLLFIITANYVAGKFSDTSLW